MPIQTRTKIGKATRLTSILLTCAALATTLVAPCFASGVNINSTTRNNSSTSTFTLCSSTVAAKPIQVMYGAGPATLKAADELKTYLTRMSGQTFVVQTVSGLPTTGIVVGTLAQFPDTALNTPLAISNGIDGKEAYAIRTTSTRLRIIGQTDKAVSHGVYRLLEELGCRWFFQSDAWEIVPPKTSVTFNRNITDRPEYLARRIWYAWGLFHDYLHPGGATRNASTDYADWSRRNRMDGSFYVNTGHSYESITSQYAAEFAAHPEYWALVNGVRQGPNIEWGNPAVRQLVINYCINYFQANPNADMVSVDPADSSATSTSPEALAYASKNDAPFKLANEVAVALRAAFPGQNKMVGLYAYIWHSDPPAFNLEPEVYVQLTGIPGGNLTYGQLLQQWPQKCRNLGFYSYYTTYLWDRDRWPGGMAGNKNNIVNQQATYNTANDASNAYATSVDAEAGNSWALHGRNYYLANKLMWNTTSNPDTILQDFYTKSFGAGAGNMKNYFLMQDNPGPIVPGTYRKAFNYVHSAAQQTLTDAAVQARIDDIKIYLCFEYLSKRMDSATTTTEQTAWRDKIWKWVYRTRYSYMNHWEAIRQSWIYDNGDPNAPWRDNTPVTHNEIETLFQEGRNYYPVQTLPTQINYSSTLQRVDLGGTYQAFAGSNAQYQDKGGGTRILMYSDGSPLTITTTCVLWYLGNQRNWTVKDQAGNVIATGVPLSDRTGNPPPSETDTNLTIPVPAPGVYEFTYTDEFDLFRFTTPANQTIAMPTSWKPTSDTLTGAIADGMYFYVPKGHTQINYYFRAASSAGPHQVVDPTGVVRKTVTWNDSGTNIKITVPTGMDGKAWKMTSIPNSAYFGFGAFQFYDCPNVMSPSQARMLIPQDLVASDGLTVVP